MSSSTLLDVVYLASPSIDQQIREKPFDTVCDDIELHVHGYLKNEQWPHLAGSSSDRIKALVAALSNESSCGVLCARGGYGASDLLPLIPWKILSRLKKKPIIGFSDISALHSAFFTKLDWPCIHAPMPDSKYWYQNLESDIFALSQIIKGKMHQLGIPLSYPSPHRQEGWLFGGCLSVLTNLIGTPFIPDSLEGAILFFEDINESYGRIFRNLNQWMQAELFSGVSAIVLGNFKLNGESQLNPVFVKEVESRYGIPVVATSFIGHCSPNLPIKLGAHARIDQSSLIWNEEKSHEIS